MFTPDRQEGQQLHYLKNMVIKFYLLIIINFYFSCFVFVHSNSVVVGVSSGCNG